MAHAARARRCAVLASACLLAPLASCVNDDPASPPEGTRTNWTAATLPVDSIFEDEPMLALARELPTFGGFWFDPNAPDRVFVGLTNSADLATAQTRIGNRLRGARGRGEETSSMQYVAAMVRYPFLELARYRTVLRQHVFSIPGVVTLGVQESSNQVVVGVIDDSAEHAVREILTRLAIPEAAVTISRTSRPVLTTSLTDPQPNWLIQGGWQVQTSGLAPCTLGFPARRGSDGSPVFIVASHCTSVTAGYDGGAIKQPTTSGLTFGYEILDPAAHSCGQDLCRESDAALFSAEADIDFARIARTTESSNCETCYMPLVVDSPGSTFPIIDGQDQNYEGEILHKIGRRTGWTYGRVEDTCVDVEVNNLVRECSDRVDYSSDAGDSGAPVFKLFQYYENVDLRGLHWGKQDGGDNDAWISDLHQIQLDLGTLVVAGLSVEITGPEVVPPNTTCVWHSWVRGGKSPASYEWRKYYELVGTDAMLYMNTGTEGFTLTLAVTDAWDGYAFDQVEVVVDQNAPPCM